MSDLPNGWEEVTPKMTGWEDLGPANPARSVAGETGLTIGAAGAGVNEGLAKMFDLIIRDPVAYGAKFAVNQASQLLGDDPEATDRVTQSVADSVRKAIDLRNTFNYFGIPVGEGKQLEKEYGVEMTPLRRIASKTGEVVGENLPVAGALKAAAGVPLAGQALWSALSGVGAGVGREAGGPWGEVIGGLSPLIFPLGAAATRGLLSGKGATAAIDDAAKAGTTLSAGQAAQSKSLSGVESTVGRYGGVGVMQRFGEGQAAGMAKKAEEAAARLAPKMDEAAAGTTFLKGLEGPGGFIKRSKDAADKLYRRVDAVAPPDIPIVPANTLSYLTQKLSVDPAAPNLMRTLNDQSIARLRPIYDGLLADMRTNNGNIPFRALTAARSRVGEQIEDTILSGAVSQREARTLYATLSQDIESGLPPAAQKAWQRANQFWQARMDRIETVIQPVVNSKAPEKVITALERSAREGSTLFGTLMKSVPPQDRSVVSAMFIRKMGEANPGAQNAAGTMFSPATFLQRWNKIDNGAKRIAFDAVGGRETRETLDAFARTAERIKRGSQVLANPSGTAAAAFNLQQWVGIGGTGVMGSALTGNIAPAAIAMGSLGMTNITARLMTNPTFVKWLSRSTQVGPEKWLQQGQRLAISVTDPQTREDWEAWNSGLQ